MHVAGSKRLGVTETNARSAGNALIEEKGRNEKSLLDTWIRDQQMSWLQQSERESAVNLTELRKRIDARVRKIKNDEVDAALAALRAEILFYAVFCILFGFVLAVFMLGDTYIFTQAVQERVIGDKRGGQVDFESIGTHDDVWDFLANRLVGNVYPAFAGQVKDPTTTMIGAMQLRQTRVASTERCFVPPIYDASLASCYPALGEKDTNIYGRLGEFSAEKICLS